MELALALQLVSFEGELKRDGGMGGAWTIPFLTSYRALNDEHV